MTCNNTIAKRFSSWVLRFNFEVTVGSSTTSLKRRWLDDSKDPYDDSKDSYDDSKDPYDDSKDPCDDSSKFLRKDS